MDIESIKTVVEESTKLFTIDIITLLAAGAGLVLGILNWRKDVLRNSVRLSVVPKSIVAVEVSEEGIRGIKFSNTEFHQELSNDMYAIHVTNLSEFPIIVNEVGFSKKWSRDRAAIHIAATQDGDRLPVKLEQRGSASLILSLPELLKNGRNRKFRKAYARTQCGEMIYGKTKSLKRLIRCSV